MEEVLQGDPHRTVVRVGDTVRRPLHPWSASVHELLGHLEAVGFPHAPRFLGVDAAGREVLTYLEGDSGPQGWSPAATDAGLVAMARLLRDYHVAVAGFRPSPAAGWAGHPGPVGPGELVCHGDFGPWNLVWRGGAPVGILDWDYAWPQRPVHDVAYALEYLAPFRPDEEAMRWLGHRTPPDRRRRIERFAEAYGLPTAGGLTGEIVAQQELVRERVRALAAAGREPQASWVTAGVLATLDDRIAWSRAERARLDGGGEGPTIAG